MKLSNLVAVASISFALTAPALAGVTKSRPSLKLEHRPPLPITDTVPSPNDSVPPSGDAAPRTLADRSQSQELLAQQGHAVIYVVDPEAHRPVRNAFVRILPLDAPSSPSFGGSIGSGAQLQAQWTGFTDERGAYDPGMLPVGNYTAEVMTFVDRNHRRFILGAGDNKILMVEVGSELD